MYLTSGFIHIALFIIYLFLHEYATLIHDDYLFVLPFWFVAVLTIGCRRFDSTCRRFDHGCRRLGLSPFWLVAVLDLSPL